MKRILTATAAALMTSTFAIAPGLAQDKASPAPELKKEQSLSGNASGELKSDGETLDLKADADAGADAMKDAAGTTAGADAELDAQGQAEAEILKQDDAAAGATAQSDGEAEEQKLGQGEAPADDAMDEDTAEAGDVSDETTASINLSAEQETEIRTVFSEFEVEPVDIDFEISIGTAAPETVVLHPLPPRIIEIVPHYEGYEYFVLADGTIVIVVPETRKVVYVLA